MSAIFLEIPEKTSDIILSMERWRVFETERKERHLAGYCVERHSWRVSSAIAAFSPEQMLMVTQSSRIYMLLGCPSSEQQVKLAWEYWTIENHVPSWKDVTDEIYARCERASASVQPTLH